MYHVSKERWRFAQHYQRLYQARKASAAKGHEQTIIDHAGQNAHRVSSFLQQLGYSIDQGLVVEVGSGAHGLIWKWPGARRVAIDPLAEFYRSAFPYLQSDITRIIAARGEQLPLADNITDVVLSDNVLDHVQDACGYLSECRRILKPTGVLYLTVDVHHRVYWWMGRTYNLFFRMGLRGKVPAFPDHPYHFVDRYVLRLLTDCRLRVVTGGGRQSSRPNPPSNAAATGIQGRMKKLFFKNCRLELIAVPVN